MKRSALVSLALMGSPLLLAGCSDSPDTDPAAQKTYASVDQCVADTDAHNTREECQKAQDAASAAVAKAPTFSAMDQCVAQYGPNGCRVEHSSSGDVFMPLMAGFLLGRALDNGSRGYAAPVYRSGYSPGYDRNYNGSPSYRPSSRPAYTPRSYTSSPSRGSSYSSTPSSRGGFGSASAARASFGG